MGSRIGDVDGWQWAFRLVFPFLKPVRKWNLWPWSLHKISFFKKFASSAYNKIPLSKVIWNEDFRVSSAKCRTGILESFCTIYQRNSDIFVFIFAVSKTLHNVSFRSISKTVVLNKSRKWKWGYYRWSGVYKRNWRLLWPNMTPGEELAKSNIVSCIVRKEKCSWCLTISWNANRSLQTVSVSLQNDFMLNMAMFWSKKKSTKVCLLDYKF